MTVSEDLDRRFREAAAAAGLIDAAFDLADTPIGTLFVASASIPLPDPPSRPSGSPAPGASRPSIYDADAPPTVPQLVVATEHYNRLVRMLEQLRLQK